MKNINQKEQDLIIIGGGIMGLMTAYYASAFVKDIIILEKRTIGSNNKEAASFSFTRSIRNDYLDESYAQLVYEAQGLWKEIQRDTKQQFLFLCGCLNIAKKSLTPDLSNTYALKSFEIINSLNLLCQKFTKQSLKKAFPQFIADVGCLDKEAGFLYLPVITKLLLTSLKKRGITINENTEILSVEEKNNVVTIQTTKTIYTTKKLVVTAALGTNAVLKSIKNNTVQFPLFPDKPEECKYFFIPKDKQTLFLPQQFPVFAYLDYGIYGHPIFDKKKMCIKIGYYNPPDLKKKTDKKIRCIADFVTECMPILKTFKSAPVTDADQCYYDMVEDDNFILGKLPNFQRIFVGCGWRGTGYKFAPLIGKILAQLALQNRTVYTIKQFSPERFVK